MVINGRDIRFRRSVRATADLAEICPNKDISKLGELMAGGTAQQMVTAAMLIHILNNAYEKHEHIVNPEYEANPISVDEIMDLDEVEFTALMTEAVAAFRMDGETDIATKPATGKGKKTRATA